MSIKKDRSMFKAKNKEAENLKKPRLLLVIEGDMEEKGLPDFIKKLVIQDELKFQVLKKTKRIHNGDTVPATKIVKDLNKICEVSIGVEAEYIACVIDLEGRNCDFRQFENDIKPKITNNNTVLGIACRSMENWILGDIANMEKAIKPCKKPNYNHFNTPDNLPHPAERLVKRHWSKYKKTDDGVKFLKTVCPGAIRKKSNSFSNFCNSLYALNESIT
jgi:hypothetical protein